VAARFSAAADEAPALVARLADQLREAEAARKALLAEVAATRAAARFADGASRATVRLGSMDDGARAEAQAVAAFTAPAVFLALAAEPPTVLLSSSPASGVDAGAALKAALGAVGGRGGGSPRIAQGTVPDAALLDEVARLLERR
jgi:alanyl-tRNA synthetase